jgi:hypothetical protein
MVELWDETILANASHPALLYSDVILSAPTSFADQVAKVQSGTTDESYIPSRLNIGSLTIFPMEILLEVFRYFTLQTLILFRRLNRSAKHLIDASHPYKYLVSDIPAPLVTLFVTLLRSDIISHFSPEHIYKSLSTDKCHVCGHFGAFMFLPECLRCCSWCLRYSPRLMPMTLAEVLTVFGLSEEQLIDARVPIIRSLQGKRHLPYRSALPTDFKEVTFVSEAHARQAAVTVHGSDKAFVAYVHSNTSEDALAYQARRERIAYQSKHAHEGPFMNHAEDPKLNHTSRFLAATHLPYLPPFQPTRALEHGVSCTGCRDVVRSKAALEFSIQDYNKLLQTADRAYTRVQFLEHYLACPEAQSLYRPEVRSSIFSVEG